LGIVHARGEFVAFLDADDTFSTTQVAEQVSLLETNLEVDFLYGNTLYWFSWSGSPEDKLGDFRIELGVPSLTLLRPPRLLTLFLRQEAALPCMTSVLVRRRCLHQCGGFDNSFKYLYSDQVLLAKLSCQFNALVVDNCWGRYRQHSKSTIHTVPAAGAHRTYLEWLQRYLRLHKIEETELTDALEQALRPYVRPICHKLTAHCSTLIQLITGAINTLMRRARSARIGHIRARPNPVYVDNAQFGTTTLIWCSKDATRLEVRVGRPNGPLFSRTASGGCKETGKWVYDGITFYLLDVTDETSAVQHNTIATVRVRVISRNGRESPRRWMTMARKKQQLLAKLWPTVAQLAPPSDAPHQDVERIATGQPQINVFSSAPPYTHFLSVGPSSTYYINPSYRVRAEASYYDATDRSNEEYQREVYCFAAEIASLCSVKSVCDIGCGSGHKLLKHFCHLQTVGVDLPPTVAWLRENHPDRTWFECAEEGAWGQHDLIICADVVEHVVDPDRLLDVIEKSARGLIVLSTPDRTLLNDGFYMGPPLNPCHVREWTFLEFHTYIQTRFEVLEHFIANPGQGAQCALCRPRSAPPLS
jgi:2-polyprenyl-3-methyl-5-hydroxy-6-metoxy-1,4-benzoquinol methylase